MTSKFFSVRSSSRCDITVMCENCYNCKAAIMIQRAAFVRYSDITSVEEPESAFFMEPVKKFRFWAVAV